MPVLGFRFVPKERKGGRDYPDFGSLEVCAWTQVRGKAIVLLRGDQSVLDKVISTNPGFSMTSIASVNFLSAIMNEPGFNFPDGTTIDANYKIVTPMEVSP